MHPHSSIVFSLFLSLYLSLGLFLYFFLVFLVFFSFDSFHATTNRCRGVCTLRASGLAVLNNRYRLIARWPVWKDIERGKSVSIIIRAIARPTVERSSKLTGQSKIVLSFFSLKRFHYVHTQTHTQTHISLIKKLGKVCNRGQTPHTTIYSELNSS